MVSSYLNKRGSASLALIFCMGFVFPSVSYSDELASSRWLNYCQDKKAEYSETEIFNMGYSKFPEINDNFNKIKDVEFDGIALPIIYDEEYELTVDEGPEPNEFKIRITNSLNSIMLIERSVLTDSPDIFDMLSMSKETRNSLVDDLGLKATDVFSNGADSISLIRDSLSYTPKDLLCTPDTIGNDLRVLLALINKPTYHFRNDYVFYELNGDDIAGYVETKVKENSAIVGLHLRTKEYQYYVLYGLKEGDKEKRFSIVEQLSDIGRYKRSDVDAIEDVARRLKHGGGQK